MPNSLLILVALMIGVNSPAYAQQEPVIVQIMAADANWADKSFTGHAFICIQLKLSNGIKEDCYGFYPKNAAAAVVGGPGVVDSELDFDKHPPTRFGNVRISVTKGVSLEARMKILGLIKGWRKDFALTAVNCVAFANAVADLAGLRTPASTNSITPVGYVMQLRSLNPGS